MFHKVLKNEEERWALCWRFINSGRHSESRERFDKNLTEEDKKIFHSIDVVEEEQILSMFGYAEADEPYGEKNPADDIREQPLHFPVIVTVLAYGLNDCLEDPGCYGVFVVDYIEQREFEVAPAANPEVTIKIRRNSSVNFPYGTSNALFTKVNEGGCFKAVRSCMNYYKLSKYSDIFIHIYDCSEVQ